MRVFPDTNVLASALMGHGLCEDLLDQLVLQHVVVLGEPVREELLRVLRRKFHVSRTLIETLEHVLARFEQAPASTRRVSERIPDPDDIPVLACALDAGVDVFVTGDRALLELGEVEGLPIISPRQLWDQLARGA